MPETTAIDYAQDFDFDEIHNPQRCGGCGKICTGDDIQLTCDHCHQEYCQDCTTEAMEAAGTCPEHLAQEIRNLHELWSDAREQRDEWRMVALQRQSERDHLERANRELRDQRMQALAPIRQAREALEA